MIKKGFHLIIALFLVLATTGISLTRHYCGGSLISTSLYGTFHSCCGQHCKRCHNESISIKITDNFTEPSSEPEHKTWKPLEPKHWLIFKQIIYTLPAEVSFSLAGKPPPLTTSEQMTRLQVFRC